MMGVWTFLPVGGKHQGFLLVDADDVPKVQALHSLRLNPRTGYCQADTSTKRSRKTVSIHRELVGLKPGDRRDTDHKNGDRRDCRRCNLRVVSRSENSLNRRGANRGALSKHRGVSWNKGKWEVVASVAGRRVYLGRFDDEEAAGEAADAFHGSLR